VKPDKFDDRKDTPPINIAELAEALNRSTSAIEKQISKLQELEQIRRIGPDKGGHWEIVDF